MWEGVGDRTELQHIDPPTLLTITAFLSSSLGLLNRGLGLSSLLRAWSRTLLQALNCNCSIGGPEGPFCWVLFSLQHPISNWLELPVHRVMLLFYVHSIPSHNWPTEYPTSAVFGMACFDHHRAEITVMQFTGHPLSVHQFVNLTLSHIVSQARLRNLFA